jgi:2-polyprenyl-3-methyl-5-hydroxy-6-metoxy-1,4-benzoquinol methylase
VIAPRSLPREYREWNRRHKAPAGPLWWDRMVRSRLRTWLMPRRMRLPALLMRVIGPFGFQENSRTREFEYPWCYFAAPIRPRMRVIDLGAGAAGFQFVLSREGADVYSVDPLINPDETVDWRFTDADFERLNHVLRARVTFVRKFLEEAGLPHGAFDRVYAISVLEHIPEQACLPLLREAAALLRPGGLLIATVDLFLDLAPFTDKHRNRYGTNVSILKLVETSGLELVSGSPPELYGYPEFDPQQILRRRDEFLVCNDVASQCIILRKPGGNGSG